MLLEMLSVISACFDRSARRGNLPEATCLAPSFRTERVAAVIVVFKSAKHVQNLTQAVAVAEPDSFWLHYQ